MTSLGLPASVGAVALKSESKYCDSRMNRAKKGRLIPHTNSFFRPHSITGEKDAYGCQRQRIVQKSSSTLGLSSSTGTIGERSDPVCLDSRARQFWDVEGRAQVAECFDDVLRDVRREERCGLKIADTIFLLILLGLSGSERSR